MIGLKRGAVELVEYDPRWPDEFSKERDSILSLVGTSVVRIAHIGSTAVPNLKAKPLIDIAIEVEDEHAVEQIPKALEGIGYTYFGDRAKTGDYFFAKGPDSKRTHYLHVFTKHATRFDEALYFRDRLRADRRLANDYQKLKDCLAQKHFENRKDYTQKKATFIKNVLQGFSRRASPAGFYP